MPANPESVADRVAPRTFEQRERELANVLQKPSPLNPPYHVGYIEDVPGEKFWVIGADGILFARISAIDDWQAETLCAMLNAANSLSAKDRRIEELERERDASAKEAAELRDGYEALDRNWNAIHEMMGSSVRDALGMPDATVPQMFEAITALRTELSTLRAAAEGAVAGLHKIVSETTKSTDRLQIVVDVRVIEMQLAAALAPAADGIESKGAGE